MIVIFNVGCEDTNFYPNRNISENPDISVHLIKNHYICGNLKPLKTMEKNLQIWAQKTKTIWIGVLLYAIGGIVYGIVAGLSSAASTASDLMSMAGMSSGGGGVGFITVLEYLLLAAVIVGYVMYILGLGKFREILDAPDATAIGKVYIGAILSAASYVWMLFGFWGWVSSVLNIVAFVFMLLGFMALKNSSTFPAKARKGASNLFISMIIGLIASVVALLLGWIPVVGGLIPGILNLIAFIMVFVGWAQIKNADPAVLL